MDLLSRVKRRIATAALAALVAALPHSARAADPSADGLAILHKARISQANQHMALNGDLRTGPETLPFRLVIDGPTLHYEFAKPEIALVVHLGDKGAQLQETTPSGTEKITGPKLESKVRGTDLSYEDLSLRFFYWPNAKYQGQETKMLRRCWVVEAQPGDMDSQYSRVVLWIEQESGAFLQADAYDKAGKLARRFVVRSVGKTADGVWILKSMRIEWPGAGDKPPTYLEINDGK